MRKLVTEFWQEIRLDESREFSRPGHRDTYSVVGLVAIERRFDIPLLAEESIKAFLAKQGVSLRQIYEHPHQHHLLHQVCEGLVDYDQLLQSWRQRHLMLVYRIIGTGTPSLKGKPSELLAHGMKQRFFPALWDVRDELFAEWTAQMQAKGKDHGYHG